MTFNSITENLPPYPMEEFNRIKRKLRDKGKEIFDFSTGDPTLTTPDFIRRALLDGMSEVSQYPSIKGTDALRDAILGYLTRRFELDPESVDVLPSFGSKEAVFHIAQCVVGRANGKKYVLYPNPGYPVYRSSTLFAGGKPYPVDVTPDSGYLLEPWKLPQFVQDDAAAIWINYPHNPTGAVATEAYLQQLVDWCQDTDTLLLSDECYVDIYDATLEQSPRQDKPLSVLSYSQDKVLAYYSLSKRSGMTGYRSGFIAGDPALMPMLAKARANFGVAQQEFVQKAAIVAWNDDDHCAQRRAVFSERMATLAGPLKDMGFELEVPKATFYLWAKLPESYGDSDVKFCTKLAEKGVVVAPSQWLSEGIKGFVRFALVPDAEATAKAVEIIRQVVTGGRKADADPEPDDSSPDSDESES